MADKRITDLPLILSGDITSTDVLPIVDVNLDITNKIEVNQLKSYILNGVNDFYVTGGTYSNGTITLNRQNGSILINGLYTGTTDVYVTGATYNTNTGIITFVNNSGGTFNVSGFFTGGTFVESVTDDGNGLVSIDNSDPLNPILIFSGVTTDGVAILGNGLNGNPITINPDYSYSLSDLGFDITPNPTKIINQNVVLPDDTNVTYPSPLVFGGGYSITIPTNTTLTIV